MRGICAGDEAKRFAYRRMAEKKQKQKENAARIEEQFSTPQPVPAQQVQPQTEEQQKYPVEYLSEILMSTAVRQLQINPDAATMRVALEILKLRHPNYQPLDKKKFTPQDYYDVIKSLQEVPGDKIETYEEHQEKEKQAEIKRLEETYHLPEKPKEAPNGNQMPGK